MAISEEERRARAKESQRKYLEKIKLGMPIREYGKGKATESGAFEKALFLRKLKKVLIKLSEEDLETIFLAVKNDPYALLEESKRLLMEQEGDWDNENGESDN